MQNNNSVSFPIEEVIPEIREKLKEHNTLIVSAPPGAGKSTLLPPALLDEKWLEGGKIVMLEPRRLAARSIAARISTLLGEPVGKTAGYRIRFENKVSKETRIEILTEGILTRMLQQDNSLEGVGMVIFDEFHERSLFADVALALCREIQQILRPDLRIIIMSATLDLPKLEELLNAPVVESAGRQFPVEIRYTGSADNLSIPVQCTETIRKAIQENDGDVLAFLPGEREILQCAELLANKLPEFVVHPLYGALSPQLQRAAIVPDPHNRRKIVLATSIAETSLTIEGISIVVDSGLCRRATYNPNNALSRLETKPISKDMADQRAGRAGRLGPGICYRMWSKATQERLSDHRIPEIEEADLTPLALDLATWGVQDAESLTWLSPPPRGALKEAYQLLEQLQGMENGKITHYGKQMNRLPCHPRIAHLLICARESGLLPLATDVAALLEERDPLQSEGSIDFNLRIEALRRHRSRNSDHPAFARIERIAASYRKLFGINAENGAVNPYDSGRLLALAYPERIATATPENNGCFQLANGRLALTDLRNDLAYEPWLAVAHLDAGDRKGRIYLAAPLDPSELTPFIKEREIIAWDSRKGGLIASRESRIGAILVKSIPLQKISEEERIRTICAAIKKEGEQLLDFNEEVTQWQNRVLSLRCWRPDEEWPDVTTSTLLQSCDEWLPPYLSNVSKSEDLKRINLVEVLRFNLDYTYQQQLDKLAPSRIEVPSGSQIKVSYFEDGRQPVLAVRLQEMFGLAETPRVNENRTPLLHLLSPGFKPVQITSDLNSFWNNAYFEVRKELRSRYPKHVWPDDPWIEPAIRGVKRR